MLKLNVDDQRRLIQTLTAVRMLADDKGREAILIAAGLQELVPQLQLAGPSAIIIPLMLSSLISYGRVTYEHEALGRFLNTVKDYTGLTDQEFLDEIIKRYDLMVPAIKSPVTTNWSRPVSNDEYVEKIIGENTLRHIAFLRKALRASRSIAYIEVNSGSSTWSGTGFLISSRLLLTNHHVLPDASLQKHAVFRFNYQLDVSGNPEIFEDFKASGSVYYASEDLDYAIVELKGEPGNSWGWLETTEEIPAIGDRVNIIQHPAGLPKQLSIQNNFIQYSHPAKLQYVTSTLPGSSGSPVFDDEWRVLAVHRAGGWLPETDPTKLYFRNEGVTLKAILNDLDPSIRSEILEL